MAIRPRSLHAPVLAGLLLWAGPAMAQFSVSPTYLAFDAATTTKAITVENVGTHEEVLRVSLINFRMLPDGRMIAVTAPGADEHFATALIRFAPRELVLAPGESEVVRLHVPAMAQRLPGEYRTHVLVQRVPDVSALVPADLARSEDMSVDLQAVLGVAVPLLIRHGAPKAEVSIVGIKLDHAVGGERVVALSLLRSGERSLRGTVSLLLDGEVIDSLEGVAVYAPAHRRDLVLRLPASAPATLAGRLEVRFTEDEDQPGALAAHAALPPAVSELIP